MSRSSPSTKRPIFTKRHYEALASVLAASRPHILQRMGNYTDESIAWERAVSNIIFMLGQDNLAFSASRFYEACHLVSKTDV